jgi:hypothetical protein
MKAVRRTFEALRHPANSPERARLNGDWRTSEYMPSHRYGLANDDGTRTPHTFRTKTEATEYAARVVMP